MLAPQKYNNLNLFLRISSLFGFIRTNVFIIIKILTVNTKVLQFIFKQTMCLNRIYGTVIKSIITQNKESEKNKFILF